MHIDFCELDEILIQFFTCPVVTEFQFSDVTPNNHGDLKLIETPASPEVDSSSTKKTSGESKATIGNKRPGPRRSWASGKRHRTLKQPFDPAAEAQKKPLVNLRPRVNPVLNPNPLTRGSNRVAKAKQHTHVQRPPPSENNFSVTHVRRLPKSIEKEDSKNIILCRWISMRLHARANVHHVIILLT
jgi:hypothetical protein